MNWTELFFSDFVILTSVEEWRNWTERKMKTKERMFLTNLGLCWHDGRNVSILPPNPPSGPTWRNRGRKAERNFRTRTRFHLVSFLYTKKTNINPRRNMRVVWSVYIHNCLDTVAKKRNALRAPNKSACHINNVLRAIRTVFLLLLLEKETCFLPTATASVGLSAHTSTETAPVEQQKAASVIVLSKTFLGLFLWQRYKQGKLGIAGTRTKVPDKNRREALQLIRNPTDADVYI